jgi:hypothetical protein
LRRLFTRREEERLDQQTLEAALGALRSQVVEEILGSYAPLRSLGEKGRARCAADVEAYLGHLARAVSTASPAVFTAYCSSARGRLEACGIPAECVSYSLHAIRRHCEAAEVPMPVRSLTMLILDRGIMASRAPLP